MTEEFKSKNSKTKKNYWDRREDLRYYSYVRALLNRLAVNVQSILDVGSADTPVLEELEWIPRRVTVDKRNPYSSEQVVGIKADFFKYEPEERFEFVICLQVLEHIPNAKAFAEKLFAVGDHVLISVPYKWKAGASDYHIHDPVDLKKLKLWTGRNPSYYLIVREPHSKTRRLICYYHPEVWKVKIGDLGIKDRMSQEYTGVSLPGLKYISLNTLKRIKHKLYHYRDNPDQLLPWKAEQANKPVRLARQAMREKAWKDAALHWEKALQYESNKKKHYIFSNLARCYRHLKEPEQVNLNMQIYLELTHDLKMEDIFELLRKELTAGPEQVTSKYSHKQGEENYGFIEHTLRTDQGMNKYLTKITDANTVKTNKEIYFYRDVCERFPVLKQITPSPVNITNLKEKGLALLTLEKIEGTYPKEKKHMPEIIKALNVLYSIKYEELPAVLGEYVSDSGFQLNDFKKTSGERVKNIFAAIEQASTNANVFKWLYQNVENIDPSDLLLDLIRKLEKLIIGERFYEKIIPANNYSLLHGNFGKTNTLIDGHGKLFIFDWDSYAIGPKGFDLAYYFWKQRWSFRKIDEVFLEQKEASDCLTDLDKLFFIYTLIVLRFIDHYSGRQYEDDAYEFLKSAIEKMESLAEQFE